MLHYNNLLQIQKLDKQYKLHLIQKLR